MVPRGGEEDQGPEKKWVEKDHPKEKRKTKNCSKTTQMKRNLDRPMPTRCWGQVVKVKTQCTKKKKMTNVKKKTLKKMHYDNDIREEGIRDDEIMSAKTK